MRLSVVCLWVLVVCLWLGIRPLAAQQKFPRPAEMTGLSATVRVDPYTPHLPARAFTYRRIQRTLSLGGIVWSLFGLWLCMRSGLSVRLRDGAYRLLNWPLLEANAPPPFRVLLLFYALLTLLLLLWNLPVALAELATEWRFGFSQESVGMFLSDSAKGWGLGLTAALALALIYRLFVWSPRRWWLWLWALTLPLLVGTLIAQPLVIAPLFNSYTPLGEGPLRAKILGLADRAGVPHANVFVENTSLRTAHVNAYVTGVGPAARIVINDTAIHSLPEDQLLAMIGHELGHYVEGHIWFGLLSGAIGSGALYYLAYRLLPLLEERERTRKTGLRGLTDLAALPLLLLYGNLLLLAQDPIANAESRLMEHRADAFGLRVTGLHEATARLMVGFAERDYSDPDPPALLHFWFGTHPTLNERIAFALSRKVASNQPARFRVAPGGGAQFKPGRTLSPTASPNR